MKKYLIKLCAMLLAAALFSGLMVPASAAVSVELDVPQQSAEDEPVQDDPAETEGDEAEAPEDPAEPEEPGDPEDPAEPEGPAEETGYVNTSALNVRSGPGTSYKKVGLLRAGDAVTVQEKQDGWYKITSGKLSGYVSAKYVVLLDAEALAENSAFMPASGYAAVGSTDFIPVQSFMAAIDPDASVSEKNGTVTVKASSGGMSLTLTASAGVSYIEANGRYLYVSGGNRYVSGLVAVPASVLAKVFNMDVYYTADGASFVKRAGAAPYLTSGSAYYNSDSLYWLSHIIYAESGNQSLTGKIAVGNVIMNRVNDRSGNWPNTIKGVIFQKNQFSPAASGSIYREPNAQSVVAAKLVLDGAQVVPTAKFFNAVSLKNTWAARNRPYVTTIGGHAFYA